MKLFTNRARRVVTRDDTQRPRPARVPRMLIRAGFALMLATLAACGAPLQITRGPVLDRDHVRRTAALVTPMNALNSDADDFGAVMPLDSGTIYFTTTRSGHQMIYVTRMRSASAIPSGRGVRIASTTDGDSLGSPAVWSAPAPAVELDNGFANGAASLAPGGETIYFTGDEYGFGDCDLYRADVGLRGRVPTDATPWSVPTNLGMRVNGTWWDSEPCVSADGSTLYFASDRPGGLGGRDIWVCRRRHDGSWEAPVNLGEPVNTQFDEMTPWITPDGAALLFASNGHPGLGGFDLFAATSSAGTTHVEHLGAPINSEADDICPTLSSDGRHAFIASNRAGGLGGYDIYAVAPVPVTIAPLVTVHGVVSDRDGHPLAATVEVTDLSADQIVGTFVTDPESGRYVLVLPRGVDYGLTATAPDHLFQSRHLPVRADLEQDVARTIDFSLPPISGTVPLMVFFNIGKSALLRESRTELDRVIAFMLSNPGVHIEIAGHTDTTGEDAYNKTLSRDRALAVKSYLVANRIVAERIEANGYGSSQPIGDNATDDGRAHNRRVELRVK